MTKYGKRRVRQEAPTLADAIVAAQDLTEDVEAQAEIAASLMGVPLESVRAEVQRAAGRRRQVQTVAFADRGGTPRAVVVERKRLTPRPSGLARQ